MITIPEATIYKEKRMVKHVENVLKLVNLGKGLHKFFATTLAILKFEII